MVEARLALALALGCLLGLLLADPLRERAVAGLAVAEALALGAERATRGDEAAGLAHLLNNPSCVTIAQARSSAATPRTARRLYANLAGSLIEHGRLKTTEAKAKAVKPFAEQMITLSKRGDLAARRRAIAELRSQDVVHQLFADVAPRFADRSLDGPAHLQYPRESVA